MQSRYRDPSPDIRKRRKPPLLPLAGIALAAAAAAAWFWQQRQQGRTDAETRERLADDTAGAELGAMQHPMTTPVAGADEMLARELAGS